MKNFDVDYPFSNVYLLKYGSNLLFIIYFVRGNNSSSIYFIKSDIIE